MIDREVALVGVIVLGFAAVIGVQYVDLPDIGFSGGSEVDLPNTTRMQKCQAYATGIETNSSLARLDATCECIHPDRYDEEQFAVSDEFDNATDLVLVQCTLPDGKSETFPIRIVANETVNGNATSVVR